MKFQQNHLLKFFNASQVFRYFQIIYLNVNLIKTSLPDKNPPKNPIFIPEATYPLINDPEERTLKVIQGFKFLAETIKNGNIDEERHLYKYRSCQDKKKLKEHASIASEYYRSILDKQDEIDTNALRKVLELQKIIWEAESYEPNPIIDTMVYSSVLRHTHLFNQFLSKRNQELLELPPRIYVFDHDEVPKYMKMFAGSG
ncbi:hypothetical protein EDEG_03581 [Edhazardia aedis USNM 41457]|uniref:Uncharacterized protein n=1 Tax=Edhazardia aedis (strain USNM 41457) TaxID=1003232 RepID=J9DH73_EDHAE|nr:hypothetical protein EDEG_03581 [Edhazardia aedis USNM 41457]|eukprot:EJW01955.1 hypothetical protein EDEG_03581 [Edhazardia aedis USNM 41457]